MHYQLVGSYAMAVMGPQFERSIYCWLWWRYPIGATGTIECNVIGRNPHHKHNASSDNQLSTHNHSKMSDNQSDSHSHTGTINNGGVAHGHGSSSVANVNASHSHSGTSAADNKSHMHGTNSAGHHGHGARFVVKYNAEVVAITLKLMVGMMVAGNGVDIMLK